MLLNVPRNYEIKTNKRGSGKRMLWVNFFKQLISRAIRLFGTQQWANKDFSYANTKFVRPIETSLGQYKFR